MPITLVIKDAALRIEDYTSRRGVGGDRPAFVSLHYWGGSAATWRKVIAGLSDEARCIAVNQRGWGGSTAADGRYDLRSMAEDVLAVIASFGLNRPCRC